MENGNHFRHKIESQRIRLADAITSGRLYQTKMILTDFTDLNYLDSEGLSPLMRAFTIDDSKYRTRRAMVKLLLDHKVDVNLRDNNGRTVLHSACKVNKLDLVQLLLEKCLQDVDITSQDTQGNTPLIYAVMNNNMHMVNLLVGALKKFSLSVDQRNNEDKTAYLRALEMGFKECASILAQVGNASQNTRVNPFLDFLPGATNQDARGKTRSRSAPLPKDYDHKRQLSTHPREVLVNRAYECVNDSLFLGNTRNMNRNKMFFKTRKTHSTTSQKASKIPKTKREFDKNYQSSVIFGGDKLQYTTKPKCVPGKTLSKTSTGEKGSVTKKKHRLLSLLLNESGSPTTIVRHSSRSGVSNTSCNQVVNEPLDTPTKASSRKENAPTVDGNVIGKQLFDGNESQRKAFPSYYSYLVWKASLDHPPNTLRSFLALRAEQSSETSSYRKGVIISKYELASDGSLNDLPGEEATSPVSEDSGKSEAGRKMSAVARTVGLSIYLNRRKIPPRKDYI